MTGFDLQAAKDAHMQWRVRLRAACNSGKLDVGVEVIRSDDACVLGAMLRNPALPAAVRASSAFQEATRLHGAFHREAGAVAALIAAGQQQQALAALGPDGAFSKASGALLAALDAIPAQAPAAGPAAPARPAAAGALQWTPALSVGVKQFDEQHQRLFALVNQLREAMAKGQGKDALGRVLDELIRYTGTHFADEERLMAAHGYPEAPAHRREHAELVRKVVAFQKDFAAGNGFITLDLMNFLKDWLVHHIQGEDQKYAPYFNGKGVR